MMTIEIDAAGQILGRLATRIAVALRGKDRPDYQPHEPPKVTILVKNAKLIKVTGRKRDQKKYYRFSGYPGGLTSRRLEQQMVDRPDWVLTMAVKRMLPPNRLRKQFLKHLKIQP